MTFISYAQNFEDVILSRVFKHVEKGFYIDVGANDPVMNSVTKAFYDRGWRGVNIEPVYRYYRSLREERAEDITLPIAAGAEEGRFNYYEIPDTGLSTLNSSIAQHHQRSGWTVVTRTVLVMPLSDICKHYAKETIHFLKVDVEGTEKQVLLGMDFLQYRPWVVLVETIPPLSQGQNFADWEDILLDSGYQYVYFDGLNRFYVAQEKAEEIKPYFTPPPNVFDNFLRYAEYCLQCDNNRLMQENLELMQQKERLEEELRKASEK